MAGGFVKNTVAGSRRGSKWPQQVKTACLCDLLAEPNIHRVAEKHGVPESTIRSWLKSLDAMSAAQRSALWNTARASAMERVAGTAAAGAQLSVEMIGRRLTEGDRNARRTEAINARLLEGPPTDEAVKLELEKKLNPPIGDYPLANFTRALMTVSVRATAALAQEEEGGPVEVVMEGEVAKYAR